MTKEFNKISTKEETRYVLETATVGGTPSGAVSSIAMPMGGIQRRKGDNLLTPESDTVKQKPRQGPLRTQTGGGKHKDKTKTIPRKAKHKTPVAETKPMSTREKVNKAVDRQRQKDKDARTGLSGMDHDQYQRQLQAKLDKKTAVSESLSPGEYYLWTVKLDDGSTKKMKWSSSYHFPEPEEINQHFEKKYGKKVVDVDFDFAIHGGQQKVTPEPYEPGGSAHSDTSATDRAIGNFDRQVPESVPGGTDTMNFMANAGIPKDEIGYAIMLLRKKQNNKTMNARELADWAVYEKKLRVLLMMRKGQSVAEDDDLGHLDAEVFGRIDKEKQRRSDLKKNDPAAYAKEMEKDSKNYGRGIMGALRRKYDQPLDEQGVAEGSVVNENSDVLAGLTDILKIAASRQAPQNPRYFARQVKDVALQLKDNPATQKWSNYLDGVVRWADVISSGKEQYSSGFADEVHNVLGPATRAYQNALLNKQGVAEDTDSWFRVTVKTPNGKNHNIQVPANSHGTAKRKALAYCAKNGIAGAEFVSAMRMPTLDEQGVAEGYVDLDGPIENTPQVVWWRKTQGGNNIYWKVFPTLSTASRARENLANSLYKKYGKNFTIGNAKFDPNNPEHGRAADADKYMTEGDEYNEYSDEVDMVKNNLLTIIRACKELANTLKDGENLPEWVEEKISMSKQNMVTVSEYLQSQHDQGHVYDEDHSTATGGWGQGSMNAAYKSSALAGAGHDDRAMEGYFGRLQERLDAEVDERSVSQAQARTMAAAAHNPAFAKKVGIKTNVAKEFNRADTGKDISKLPKRVITKKRKK